MFIITLKFFALFFAIWFTMVNIAKLHYKSNIPTMNFVLQASAIATFLFLQFNMYKG